MSGDSHRIASCPASVVLVIGGALLAACSIGPKYTRPSAPVPPAYKELKAPDADPDWKPVEPRDDAARGKWWERFGDPRLNEARGESRDLEPEHCCGGSQCPGRPSHNPGSADTVFSDCCRRPRHYKFTSVHRIRKAARHHLYKLLLTLRGILGAGSLGAYSSHSSSELICCADNRGGSGECPPLRPSRSRCRLLRDPRSGFAEGVTGFHGGRLSGGS